MHPSSGSSMLQKQSRLAPYFAAKLERSPDSIGYMHPSGIDSFTSAFFRINSFTRIRSKYLEKMMKGNNESWKIKPIYFLQCFSLLRLRISFWPCCKMFLQCFNLQNLSEKKWLLLHFLHKCIIRIRLYNKFCRTWKKKGL